MFALARNPNGTFTQTADRAGPDLRRPGRDRHRKRAPVRRSAGANARSYRSAGAADRDRRGAEGHQPLGVRSGPVFEAIARKAARLCGADAGDVHSVRRRGLAASLAQFGLPAGVRRDAGAPAISGRTRRCRRPAHGEARRAFPTCWPIRARSHQRRRIGPAIARMLARAAAARRRADRRVHRSIAQRSPTVHRQADRACSQTFADQAVIAIENARLFDEVQAKTRDLERIAAAADRAPPTCSRSSAVSPFDCQPVLRRIVEMRASCAGRMIAACSLQKGDELRASAQSGCIAELVAFVTSMADQAGTERRRASDPDRRTVHHVPTCWPTRSIDCGERSAIGMATARCSACRCCARARRSAPSRSRRTEVRPFTDKQIELVADFRRPGRDRDRECRACSRKCRRAPELPHRSTTCAPRRIAWCRPRSSPRSASSPPASRTRSRTRSTSSTISRRCRRELIDELNDVLKAAALDEQASRRGRRIDRPI